MQCLQTVKKRYVLVDWCRDMILRGFTLLSLLVRLCWNSSHIYIRFHENCALDSLEGAAEVSDSDSPRCQQQTQQVALRHSL